jgi:hypothetical protein
MDSDVFIVRSLVPVIMSVIFNTSSYHQKLWAVKDYPDGFHYVFSLGLFMIKPSSLEFEKLMCMLHGKNCSSAIRANIEYWEPMAEQGFLNAVYQRGTAWVELPREYSTSIRMFVDEQDRWRMSANKIQCIHFTTVKPWNWECMWSTAAPACYIFWNKQAMQFHSISSS